MNARARIRSGLCARTVHLQIELDTARKMHTNNTKTFKEHTLNY